MNATIERTLGRLLRRVRAGDAHLSWNAPGLCDAPATIVLTSPDFVDGGAMSRRSAGKGVGDNLSPPLAWSNVPAEARALVLIMEDPDVPLRRPVVHLIAGIAPERSSLAAGALTPGADPALSFGRGFGGRVGYAGPRPVRGHGPHRYVFQLYALAAPLDAMPDLAGLLAGIRDRVLARGRLTGIYERH
jgi:Raf kinase inhibitor-like YbhB/YbcL family protein